MILNLSILSTALGLLIAGLGAFGLAKPAACSQASRSFPRSFAWGCVLMLAGTGWFLYNLSQESISDFAAYQSYMIAGFALVGIGSCVFVRDLLAVRGLAVVLLLLGKLLVDTGRPFLPKSSWVLVIQTFAYLIVVIGMWLTVSPWRLRDWIAWTTANPGRLSKISALMLGFGLLLAALGLSIFRSGT